MTPTDDARVALLLTAHKAYALAWALTYVVVVGMCLTAAALIAVYVFAFAIWPLIGPPLNAIAGVFHDLVQTFGFWGYAARPVP